jgi:phospholipase/carboxylesterase
MTNPMNTFPQSPHQGQPVLAAGEPVERARAAMVMLHGRGARAEDILTLVSELDPPGLEQSAFAFLAPQAAENTWYPNRFFAPLESNEPWLSSALARVGEMLARIEAAGVPPERVVLLGFSQGACLALEYAARNPRHYGGVVGLSGALIGPQDMSREYPGTLAGTPVFLGCSDVDVYVSKDQVEQAAGALRRMGGLVTMRLYANMDHTVNQDEIQFVRMMMQDI